MKCKQKINNSNRIDNYVHKYYIKLNMSYIFAHIILTMCQNIILIKRYVRNCRCI